MRPLIYRPSRGHTLDHQQRKRTSVKEKNGGSILSLQASIVSVHVPPTLHFELSTLLRIQMQLPDPVPSPAFYLGLLPEKRPPSATLVAAAQAGQAALVTPPARRVSQAFPAIKLILGYSGYENVKNNKNLT
jgi:hypothetical protein